MTTTHSLMHRIAHDCPICEKNNISSLIISSGNERTLQKSNSTLKFQNKPEPIKTNPNVVIIVIRDLYFDLMINDYFNNKKQIFSRAYKTERPHYVKNLKSLIKIDFKNNKIEEADKNLFYLNGIEKFKC
jgi:Leucine-rich repeat (LRR) protein